MSRVLIDEILRASPRLQSQAKIFPSRFLGMADTPALRSQAPHAQSMQTKGEARPCGLMRLATARDDFVSTCGLALPAGAGWRDSQWFIEVVPLLGIQAEFLRRPRPSTSHSSSDSPSVECIPPRDVAASRPNFLFAGRDELAATLLGGLGLCQHR
jgi:hypothetical protein